MRWLVRILLSLVGAWLALCAVVFLVQRRMQYFPDTHDPAPPDGVEDVTLETSDGVSLRAWYWPGTRDTTLVVFHGNAGHRGDRTDWLRPYHNLGWGLFLVDYRGFGGSGGSPTERGLYDDATACLAWLDARGLEKLVYFGESLGCGVAVELATRRVPVAMVLQSGAISLVDVAADAYPYLPVRLLMSDRYDCRERIAQVTCPLLCVHGERDSLIAPRLGRALFDAGNEPKQWYVVPNADHNDLPWIGGGAYYKRVHRFLETHTQR